MSSENERLKSSLSKLSHVDEIEESIRQFQEVWKMYARGGVVEEAGGVLAAWAGMSWPIVNALFLTSPVADAGDLSARLERIGAFVAGRPQFGMLVTCEARTPRGPEIEAALAGHGWRPLERLTGMVKDGLSPETLQSDTPPPPGLVYRRVRDQELRQAVADINAVSYGVPIEVGREAVDRESVWDDACFGYVGFAEGKPVTTAVAYVRAECLYVALVATAPEARKRGYAQSITTHALREAAASSGLRRSILHATSMARSIYERLGFRPVVDFSVHLPATLLQAMGAHNE